MRRIVSGDPESMLAVYTTNPSGLSAITISTTGTNGTAITITGDNFTFATVPEASSYGLFLGLGAALCLWRLRKRRTS